MKLPREIRALDIEDIYVGEGRRELHSEAVVSLAASMKDMGLMTPISVRIVDGPLVIDGEEVWSVPCLIAGAHRLAAAKANGWQKIDCYILTADDIDAERWEIIENLHRAELTLDERATQFERYEKLRQVAAVYSGGRGNTGGNRQAARELGIDEREVRRLKKIASIDPEARKVAREAGIGNNQSKMLRIAAAPRHEQVRLASNVKPVPPTLNEAEALSNWLRQGQTWWNRAPESWRDEWRAMLDGGAVFDRTRSGAA